MSKILTGIQDLDLKIISYLNDNELSKICRVNKYVSKLCNDENFWRERMFNLLVTSEKVFTREELNKFKDIPRNKTWKEYYKFLMNFAIGYILSKSDPITLMDTEDTDRIIQTLLDNGYIVDSLLENRDYDALDKFLNEHLLFSPGESETFISADSEQVKYLLHKSITDTRFDPNHGIIFYQGCSRNDEIYKLFLEYMDPNIALQEILRYGRFNKTNHITYILQHPGIKLDTLLSLIFNKNIKSDYIKLLKNKAKEMWPQIKFTK